MVPLKHVRICLTAVDTLSFQRLDPCLKFIASSYRLFFLPLLSKFAPSVPSTPFTILLFGTLQIGHAKILTHTQV